jgi:hypothetical protein
MPALKNWSISKAPSNLYQPPEYWDFKFAGNVYGHPNFDDGHNIITSTPIDFDPDEMTFVTKSGTHYTLEGLPDPKWLQFLDEGDHDIEEYFDCLTLQQENSG